MSAAEPTLSWPANLAKYPNIPEQQLDWLADPENRSFVYLEGEPKTYSRPAWSDTDSAVQSIVGAGGQEWRTWQHKVIGRVIHESSLKPGVHENDILFDAISEWLVPELLYRGSWAHKGNVEARNWLNAAIRILAPRFLYVYRQEDGRKERKGKEKERERNDAVKGEIEDEGSPSEASATTTTASKPPAKSKTWKQKEDSTTRCASVPIRRKATKKIVKKRIGGEGKPKTEYIEKEEGEEEERTRKMVHRLPLLRCLERNIVIMVKDRKTPLVMGMGALIQEKFMNRSLDDMSHIHLSFDKLKMLLVAYDIGFDSDYAVESLELRWMDPASRQAKLIGAQWEFTRAVGVLGNVAGEKPWIELSCS